MNLLRIPAYATRERFNWKLLTGYILLHCGLLLAPFTFSFAGLAVGLVLYFVTICLGITLCYHRLLAHRSYKAVRWVKYVLAFCGMLAYQRGPIWWVATHRLHHSQVDTELDPHTPAVSLVWSHFLWAFFRHPQLDDSMTTVHRLARDLAEDPGLRFLEKYYSAINVGFLGLLSLAGYLFGGPKMALSFFIWAGVVRLVATLHITWFVNSVAHIWGYRNYVTADTSRNNWWVAILTFGEGWHNNHHADQRAARNGHRWFEIDVTYYLILLMKKTRLAMDVVPVSSSRIGRPGAMRAQKSSYVGRLPLPEYPDQWASYGNTRR